MLEVWSLLRSYSSLLFVILCETKAKKNRKYSQIHSVQLFLLHCAFYWLLHIDASSARPHHKFNRWIVKNINSKPREVRVLLNHSLVIKLSKKWVLSEVCVRERERVSKCNQGEVKKELFVTIKSSLPQPDRIRPLSCGERGGGSLGILLSAHNNNNMF